MKVYIETYGCAANQAESEIMAGILSRAGAEIVKNPEIADVVIVNSCIVKQVTEQKIIYRIKEFQKMGKKIIITGCMPEGAYDRTVELFPNVSLVSTHRIKEITKAVLLTMQGKRVELLGKTKEPKLCLPRIRKNPIVDIVEISDGCTGACTYCATKLAKGYIFSYPKNLIIKEIREAVKSGCKEIWITSQDTAAYGMDEGERRLPELLKSITKIDGKFFVRVGMANPDNVLPILSDLIDAYNNKKIYKFLHVPVQSGSDEILRAMNRSYTVKDFVDIVESFRKAFRCQIWTDIIVGYPGETEEQFMESIKLLKIIKPDYVNVSRFASRPGTPASKLKQLPTEEMKRRTRMMSSLVERISFEKNKEWIGWEGEILITEHGKKEYQWIGRNFAYKPVVVNLSDGKIGKFVKVKITDALPTSLIGRNVK